ncbi:hypothetical protein [Streptomyces justiciae]|uniref:hypothetical protein n=1 Tax=Streptomyces justiciae TaxID=2780140 RepID=UPI0021179A15|nr:hypothetical protein [Streptomyces justiciae]MCW8382421.1 hypothetical protein [Streptomyces justiciae]
MSPVHLDPSFSGRHPEATAAWSGPFHQVEIDPPVRIFAPAVDPTTSIEVSPGQWVRVLETADGLRTPEARPDLPAIAFAQPGLLSACNVRSTVSGGRMHHPAVATDRLESLAAGSLVLPRSERWNQALSTALLGDWCAPLLTDGFLPATALGALRAEARTVHRHLVPIWRRRTRHGRVLSLDADLGDGLSLYDLVAADVDLLAHTMGGVFEDARLNRLLGALDPAERAVVFAYADGEGATWTEAAAVAGADDAKTFGERVRRKTKRIAAEQARRTVQQQRPGAGAL